jgi:hypothetical protein
VEHHKLSQSPAFPVRPSGRAVGCGGLGVDTLLGPEGTTAVLVFGRGLVVSLAGPRLDRIPQAGPGCTGVLVGVVWVVSGFVGCLRTG